MAVEIVSEIITEVKLTLDALLTSYARLDYEFEIEKNSDRGNTKRFGFIPGPADFKEGSALGFTTMLHTFQLILTTDYQNKDDDSAQANALQGMYAEAHGVIKAIQKKSITLPTSGYTVLLISGANFDDPEHFNDNSSTALRANLVITYRFRNNI